MITDGQGKVLPALPEHLPPRLDPQYGGRPGIYASSAFTDVVGSLSNPIAEEARRHKHYAGERSHLSATNPAAQEYVETLGGFDARADLEQPPASEWPMTGIISRIGLAAGGRVDLAPFPGTYIVDFMKLSPGADGVPRHPWATKIKQQLPKGSRLLLSFWDYQHQTKTGGVWQIDDLWTNEKLRPVLAQFDAIIVPNLLSFSDIPYPAMLQGERMDQILVSEGRGSGNTIIPSIAWGEPEHSLRRQMDLWLSKSGVNTLCCDCHGPGYDRTLWTWRWLIALERYAASQPQVRWILTGITQGWAIRELNRIFPKGNYHLIMPLSSYVHAKGATSDIRLQEEHFRRAVERLDRLRAGADVAHPKARPAKWPTAYDCRPRTI